MKIRELRQLTKKWIDILELGEWKGRVKVNWGTEEELKNAEGDALDGVNIFSTERRLSEVFINPELEDHQIIETLVHELLHLVVDGHKNSLGEYDAMHERALDRLAEAFVKLTEEK